MVLDLTPNYKGSSSWFASADLSAMIENVKVRQNVVYVLLVNCFNKDYFIDVLTCVCCC